ncbi:hypothetical protein TRFO_07435 [Tritrichomonas foetus]|uniref:Uncharacterized protein n=1 Tax=Tritrichomonas foetus TaxID=1144522 RepID=A0A1J4JRT8_9EUKA|nr:hypothetical protein TRFO_07435 [Tritrichomonas foetus]|eukprot:OHT01855.1 hypothetical protein TRFO_07435 [Tritrichomonas foetus]
MYARKKKTSFTLNPNDPLPKTPDADSQNDLRPPPKIFNPYREYSGYAPQTIKKMMKQKKEYEEECERIRTEHEIAVFEARQKGLIKSNEPDPIPIFPTYPKEKEDFLNSFQQPSSTRFYDYKCPDTRPPSCRSCKKTQNSERNMAHGCPCCNPSHYDEIKAEIRPSTRNGKFMYYQKNTNDNNICSYQTTYNKTSEMISPYKKEKNELPLQINASLWNIVDEPMTSSTRNYSNIENHQHAPLKTGRINSQDGRIPLMSEELKESERECQTRTELLVEKILHHEKSNEEKIIHERQKSSRNFNRSLNTRTKEIGVKSKQDWATTKLKERNGDNRRNISNNRVVVRTKKNTENKGSNKMKQNKENIDDLKALDELSKYDNKLYHMYKSSKKNPTLEIAFLMQQNEVS